MIKDLIYEALMESVVDKLITELPFLALPVINPIFVFFTRLLFSKLYIEISRKGGYVLIDIKSHEHELMYQQMTQNLITAVESKEGIDEAKIKYKRALRDLIFLNQ